MNYFSEAFDEVTSETNSVQKEQEMERSDNRPSVSLHRKSPEKQKRKQKIIIGRKRPYESSTSISNQNASLGDDVAKQGGPSAASATPHRGPKRFLNVVNGDSDQDARAAVLAKSAAIMKNIATGKHNPILSPSLDKENRRPLPTRANPAVGDEKPSEAGGLTQTPRHVLLASLDDFSPSPVVRRDPPEGIRSYSPDVPVQQNVHGLETRDEELNKLPPPVIAPLVRTSTTAEVNVPAISSAMHASSTAAASDATKVPQPSTTQLIHDTPKASTVSIPTNKARKATSAINRDVGNKENGQFKDLVSIKDLQKTKTLKKPMKTLDVVDDASILEEETPTFQKTPARFVNREKRGSKRNKFKDKLESHDEEQEDPNVNSEEEEPPDISTTKKPYVTRESDVDEWFGPIPPRAAKPPEGSVRARLAREEGEALDSLDVGVNSNLKSSSTDTTFKKPLLPSQPKKKGRTVKTKEVNKTREELSGEKSKPEEATKENPRKNKEAKSSDKARVGEKRKAEVPQEELMERRYLTKWVPLLRNKKLYIEGDLMNFDSVLPGELSSKWITSKIVSRISDQRVATKKTCYVLEGQLAIPAPGERPMPLFVIDKFKDGFPENWQNVIQHWNHFNDQSLVTEASNQTILTNIQSLTMTMFNSTPMPGMMSNINISNMSSIANASRALSRTPVKNVAEVNEMAAVHASKSRSPAKRVVTETNEDPIDEVQPTVPIESLVDKPASSSQTISKRKSLDQQVAGPSTDIPTTAASERPSRSKTVRNTVNQSTHNKSAANKSNKNLLSPNQSQSIRSTSSAGTNPTYTSKGKRVSMTIEDGEKHFNCDFCDYVGKNHRWNLTRHIKRNHPNEDSEAARSLSNSNKDKSHKNEKELMSKRSLSESSVAEIRKEARSNSKKSSENVTGKSQVKDKNTKTSEKKAEEPEDTRPSRGKAPSSSAKKNTSETTAEAQIQNLTMSIHDFSQLKFAKNYQHIKMVKSKKFYLCKFCEYQCTTFAMVKKHLKDLHVDEEVNDEENNVPPKDDSPSPPKSKPQSKSPIKRKVNSKNKSPPVKSYGELFQAVQGQQEISAKKSRFGRKLIKRKNRSSWVDVTPSPNVHELEVSKNKKNESTKIKGKGRPRKVETSQTEQIDNSQSKQEADLDAHDRVLTGERPFGCRNENCNKRFTISSNRNRHERICPQKSKKTVAEEVDDEIREPAKTVKKVQNPFRVDGAGDKLPEIPTKVREPLQNMHVNPKTVKDRIRNAAILKDFNDDHEDDMFGISAKVGPKGDAGRLGNVGLLGNLDDSDSGNDISIHSNRTPITKYMGSQAWRNDANTPSLGLQKTPSEGSDIQQTTGFQSEAFIHKKVIENKKEARERIKKKLKKALALPPTSTQIQSEVEESTRIIDNIAKDWNTPEDEDEVEDDYFDFEPEEGDRNFSCDNPAVMKLWIEEKKKKEKLLKNNKISKK